MINSNPTRLNVFTSNSNSTSLFTTSSSNGEFCSISLSSLTRLDKKKLELDRKKLSTQSVHLHQAIWIRKILADLNMQQTEPTRIFSTTKLQLTFQMILFFMAGQSI